MTSAVKVERLHWPEYLIEAAGLGTFMVAACVFTVLIWHPESFAAQWIQAEWAKRLLMGVAMGGTAVAIIYSPWGRRSGAHLNPAVTLSFYRLGKVRGPDAIGYVLAQVVGGVAGVLLSSAVLGARIAHPKVNYAVTVPGPYGNVAAFAGEVAISFLLMSAVLFASNTPRLARLTGLIAGSLVMTWIVFESPLSGMSMNPARSLGSAANAAVWTSFWIYVLAPLAGMLLAAEIRWMRHQRVMCAKLNHTGNEHCIFSCGYSALLNTESLNTELPSPKNRLSSMEVTK